MKLQPVSDDLFAYLMARTSGSDFEAFSKQVFASQFGESFIPLGGMHDGGADGVISSFVQELEGKPNTFIQFTVTQQENAKEKIQDTINALRKVGREPKSVIYATSAALPKFDSIVATIFEENTVLVQIRDVERIKSYVNTNSKANSAFYSFFSNEITALTKAATLQLPTVSGFARDPTVYVFLNHELRDRFTDDKLNTRVLDGLIYWALRETDPDKNVTMSRSEIATSIENAFPVAKSILLAQLNQRLDALSKREAGVGERLRHYRQQDTFSLPFEMRKQLASDASEALLAQERFKESIQTRIGEEYRGDKRLTKNQMDLCVKLVFLTVHQYFIDQGLLLAAFLEGKLEEVDVSDQVVEDIMVVVLAELEHRANLSPGLFGLCLSVLRGIFYRSNDQERAYMLYLSRTSCLFVTMRSAPKLLEYLNQMGGNFRLIVGTDLLIKAVSEVYLDPAQRQVTNLLKAVKGMGCELILSEPVVTEVFTHLHASDLEFSYHYAEREPYLKDDDVSACDRILIRAYLYARRNQRGPNSWRAYVHQLVDPDALRAKSEAGRVELQGLLTLKFGMSFGGARTICPI